MTIPSLTKARLRAVLPPAALCTLVSLLGVLLLNETMMYTPDSAHYIAWAKSLAAFDGWRITLGPEPFRYVFNAPLYPLLLAPAGLVFPYNVIAGKVVTLLFGVLTVAMFYRHTATRTGPAIALAAGFVLTLNPLLLIFSTQILSDIPFAACVVLFLMIADRLAAGEPRTSMAVALVATTSAALFLREIGVAVVVAAVTLLATTRKYRTLLVLILTVTILYGLWYLRNEIGVAAEENPDLRNTRLLFSHVYTGSDTSLLSEFTARASGNSAFYSSAIATMLFAPQDQAWTYGVIRPSEPLLAAVNSILPTIRLPLLILTLVLCGAGVAALRRERAMGATVLSLVAVYTGILVVYPVSDIRFLFPMLLIMVWLAARGVHELLRHLAAPRRRAAGTTAVLLTLAALVPNVAWVGNAIATNAAYHASPDAFMTLIAREEPLPNELTLIRRPAAEWIAANSPASTVVMCRYKDAGLWLQGRPVLTPNPLLALEDFDAMLRDYGVTYILTGLLSHEVRDYEAQMALSERFRFVPVFSYGDTEVLRVEPKTAPQDPSIVIPHTGLGPLRKRYLQGILSIRNGDYPTAATLFRDLQNVRGLEIPAIFYTAVAEECAFHLEAAEDLYRQFRTIPQAAHYLQQAKYHEDIIAMLRQVERPQTTEERASLYHTISLSYWILGLRHQGAVMMERALQTDPALFIGHVFGALYSLAGGDTAAAKQFISIARRFRPADPLVHSLRAIETAIDSLPLTHDRASLELGIGKEYVSMGLYELGIDQAVKALRYNPRNTEALRTLADLYTRKQRTAPALDALRRLAELAPDDSSIKGRIRQLSR